MGPSIVFSNATVPGASTGDPTHDKVMWRDLRGKASQVSRGPLPERLPSNQNLSVYCLLYYTLLTLQGDIPDHLSLEKVNLNLKFQKTKVMATGPITSWQIDGETVETVGDFILGGSKITAHGECSHEIKRHLLLGRKVMTNLEHIKRQRHYFANKGPSSQGYGFSSGHV